MLTVATVETAGPQKVSRNGAPTERPAYSTWSLAFEKIQRFWSRHTLEPLLFLCMFAYSVKLVTFQNLIEERVCLLHLRKSENTCLKLEDLSNKDVLKEVQGISNNILALGDIVVTFPAAFATILLGPWSDLYGRRLVAALAILGLFLENLGLLIYSFCRNLDPYLSFVFIAPSGLFGGMMMVLTASYSHVTDSSRTVVRANRYAALEFAFMLGGPFGMLLGGLLFKAGRYAWVFGFSAAHFVIAVLWTYYLLPETLSKPKPLLWRLDNIKIAIQDLFDRQNLRNNFNACFRARPYNFRKQLWLLILAMAVLVMCILGSTRFNFSFTQNRLGWDVLTYSTYGSVLHLVQAVVVLISVPVLTAKLAIREGALGIMGTLSLAAQLVIKAFSTNEWLYVYAYVAGLLGGTARVAARTRISKLVTKSELGRVFSALALCEVLVPVGSNAIFTKVYQATIHTMPGAPYLAAFVLLLIPLSIFGWIYAQGQLPVGVQDDTEEHPNLGAEFERFDQFIGSEVTP